MYSQYCFSSPTPHTIILQAALKTLREKWQKDAEVVRKKGHSGEVKVLARARRELDRQADTLNREVKELQKKEFFLKQRVLRSHGEWTEESDTCSLASSFPSRPAQPRAHRRAPRRYQESDPRVMIALSTLTQEVRRLSDKVTQIEGGGGGGGGGGAGGKSARSANTHWQSFVSGRCDRELVQCW